MAGWSMVADGSVLDCVKTTSKRKNLEPNSFNVDLEPPLRETEPESEKFRRCFDYFLGVFLQEICAQESYRPFPPMLGDEQSVELFKLFSVVKDKGGYDTVSRAGLWDLVAEESGFHSSVSSSVKLIYVKYLDAFERWLKRVFDDKKDTKCKSCDSGLNLCGCLMELGAEFKVFLSDLKKRDIAYSHLQNVNSELNFVTNADRCKIDVMVESSRSEKCVNDEKSEQIDSANQCKNDVVMVESSRSEKCVNDEQSVHIDSTNKVSDFTEIAKFSDNGEVRSAAVDLEGNKNDSDVEVDSCSDDFDVVKSVYNTLDFGRTCCDKEVMNVLAVELKGDNKCADSDKEDALIADSSILEEKNENSSRKRKWESMWKMLSWVTGIAKDPCSSRVGSLPDKSKWKSYGNQELWKQVLSYRNAVFMKRQVDSNGEQSIVQKSQKMHPSLYDDQIGTNYNLRERLSSGKKTCQAGASSKFSVGAQNDSCKGGMDNHDHQGLLQTIDSPTPQSVFDYDVEKPIPLGPGFQAEVPEWTGVPSESDDFKWLGTRVWPLQRVEHKFFIERDPIGKGGQDSCGCQVRGSVECVRFHIAEKRYRLKLELGSAFHSWKFDKMGEEARLSWSEEERKSFETIVKFNPPSLDKCFWEQIFKYFRNKSREELVSYYYNVFLLQRRAQQNRFTLDNIDSDDDCESDSGVVARSFGHEIAKSASSIFHSPNKKQKKW